MLNNKHITKYFANGLLLSVLLTVLCSSFYFNDAKSSVVKDKTVTKKEKGALTGPPDGPIGG